MINCINFPKDRLLAIAVLFSLGACASPDLEEPLTAFSAQALAANDELRKYAAPFIARDLRRAELHALATGRPAATLSPECGFLKNGETDTRFDACVVEGPARPSPGHGTWFAIDDFAAEMDVYLRAFSDLASADTGTEIAAASTGLLNAASNLSPDNSASATEPIGVFAGRFANSQRYRALRQAAEAVDSTLDPALNDILVAIRKDAPALDAAAARLDEADEAVQPENQPELSEVKELKDAHTAFIAEANATPIPSLLAMRSAHRSLLVALQRDATLTEIRSLLDDLQALRDSL